MEASVMLVCAAIVLRVIAGAKYFVATVKRQVQPSPVSWFFWGLTAMIAFGVQLSQEGGVQALTTLALGIGPVAVFAVSMWFQRGAIRLSRLDKGMVVMASVGIICWLFTKDAMLALWFSIIADAVSSVPTLVKSYANPGSEQALPYLLSCSSMVCALAAIQEWTVAAYAFSAYILGLNMVLFSLIASRVGPRLRQWRIQRRQAFAEEAI